MSKIQSPITWVMLVLFCFFGLSACGGSSSSSTGSSGGGAGTTGIFPTDLVLASPFAVATSSASVSASNSPSEMLMTTATDSDDYLSKVENLGTLLTATSTDSCGFTLSIFETRGGSVNCYGPSLTYANHPDAPSGEENGSSGGGDAGIWNELENDEACAAAQTDYLVNQVGSTVDMAVNSIASMLCVINASDESIPAAGAAALDVSEILQSALTASGVTGLTISTATLEHQANDADGNSVYFFTLTGIATNEGETRALTFYLKHIPLDTDNITYKGKLSYAISDDSGSDPGNCNDENTVGSNTSTTTMDAGSILYHKDSATNLTYRLQQGVFCDSSHMPLDTSDNYDIDKTDAASSDNPTGYANGFQYYLFNMNPEDGTGSYAFSWVAGAGGENTRTLNVTLSNLDSGSTGGCSYFGYGPQVSDTSSDLGSISGFFCNWGMPSENDLTMYELAQRQCMSLDAATGKYTTDTDLGSLALVYAPTENCDTSAGNGFTYYMTSGSESDPATNDRYTASSAVTNQLINVSDVDFVLPTEPDDVY